MNLGRKDEALSSINEALNLAEDVKVDDSERQKVKINLKNQRDILLEHKTITLDDENHSNKDLSVKNSNQKLPAFSDDVKLYYDDVRGRYGVATKDLEPGTVVLEESPVSSVLKPQYYKTHCNHCFAFD